MNIFVPIIIIGVLVIVTVILMSFDKLIGGDVEKTITINKENIIKITESDTLLNSLSKEKVFIPSACGGKATCGACKFRLIEPKTKALPTEEPFLSKEENENGIRLSCQTKVRESMEIEVPKELLNAKEYLVVVEDVKDLTYDIKLVRLKLGNDDEIIFKPGQYAQIKVPGIEAVRAYSIASDSKDKKHIEFIIRKVKKGQATTFIHKALEIGDTLTITGPYGDFYLQEDSDREIVCIAGGSGKAPIRSILMRLKDLGMNRTVKYFFGARSTEDLYMTSEFRNLEKEFANFKYIPALSACEDETWDGEEGLITEVVSRYYKTLDNTEAYLCGSPGMIDACINVLKQKNMDDENIHFDKF